MPKPIFDPDNKYVRYGGVVLFAVCYMSFIILVEVIRFLRKIMKGIVDIYCEYVVTIENILTSFKSRFHFRLSGLPSLRLYTIAYLPMKIFCWLERCNRWLNEFFLGLHLDHQKLEQMVKDELERAEREEYLDEEDSWETPPEFAMYSANQQEDGLSRNLCMTPSFGQDAEDDLTFEN